MIGIWMCPFPVALLYLRISGKTWRASFFLGGLLGICISVLLFGLFWMAMAGIA